MGLCALKQNHGPSIPHEVIDMNTLLQKDITISNVVETLPF